MCSLSSLHKHLAYSLLYRPAGSECLLARNSLVNKVEFLGLVPQKVVMTNEVARLVIISSKIFDLYLSIRTFSEWVWHKMFLNIAK